MAGKRSYRSKRKRSSKRLTPYQLAKIEAQGRLGTKKVWFDKVDNQWYQRQTPQTLEAFGYSPATATEKQILNRRERGYHGRGDYWSAATALYNLPWKKMYRTGRSMYRAGVRSWYGRGDYSMGGPPAEGQVSTYGAPVTNQLMQGGNPPISVNASSDLTGDIEFCNTEFVANINVTGTTFENRTFALNPGLPETFPFLSQIAQNFTLFEFIGLVFQYKPTSGEFGSASNSLGKVIMATNYDPNDQPFASARVMENYDYAESCKPSLTQNHGVETAQKQTPLQLQYIRTNDGDTRDRIFSDLGVFQLATEGMPSTGIAGELWVSYKVRLSRSKINQSGTASFIGSADAAEVTSNRPFAGLRPATDYSDNIGLTAPTGTNRLSFPNNAKSKAYVLTYVIDYVQTGALNQPDPNLVINGGVEAPVIESSGTPGTFVSQYIDAVDTTNATPGNQQKYTYKTAFWFNDNTVAPSVDLHIWHINPSQIATVRITVDPLNLEMVKTAINDGIVA